MSKAFLRTSTALSLVLAAGAASAEWRTTFIDPVPSQKHVDFIDASTAAAGKVLIDTNNSWRFETRKHYVYSAANAQETELPNIVPDAINPAGTNIYGSYKPNPYNTWNGYLDTTTNLWQRFLSPFTDIFSVNSQQSFIGFRYNSGRNMSYHAVKHNGAATTVVHNYDRLRLETPFVISENNLVLLGRDSKGAVHNLNNNTIMSFPIDRDYPPYQLDKKYLMGANGNIIANSKNGSPKYFKYVGAQPGAASWYDEYLINKGNYSKITITGMNSEELVGIGTRKLGSGTVVTDELHWRTPHDMPEDIARVMPQSLNIAPVPEEPKYNGPYTQPNRRLPQITEPGIGRSQGNIIRRHVTPGNRNILQLLIPLDDNQYAVMKGGSVNLKEPLKLAL